jgi:8-oxo-dGTP diphosphatase
MRPCSKCHRYYNRNLTIDALIIRNGKILLVKRKKEPFSNYWALPGGYVDWNETVEKAVLREVKEETGLDGKIGKLVGIYSEPRRHPLQLIAIAYQVDFTGRTKSGSDVSECKFFPLTSLPNCLAFDHKKIIADYLTMK